MRITYNKLQSDIIYNKEYILSIDAIDKVNKGINFTNMNLVKFSEKKLYAMEINFIKYFISPNGKIYYLTSNDRGNQLTLYNLDDSLASSVLMTIYFPPLFTITREGFVDYLSSFWFFKNEYELVSVIPDCENNEQRVDYILQMDINKLEYKLTDITKSKEYNRLIKIQSYNFYEVGENIVLYRVMPEDFFGKKEKLIMYTRKSEIAEFNFVDSRLELKKNRDYHFICSYNMELMSVCIEKENNNILVEFWNIKENTQKIEVYDGRLIEKQFNLDKVFVLYNSLVMCGFLNGFRMSYILNMDNAKIRKTKYNNEIIVINNKVFELIQ